jgi:hypothetical protein
VVPSYEEDGGVTEVIRPAAVVPEEAARTILVELSLNSVVAGGLWNGQPSRWERYDRPWAAPDGPGVGPHAAQLLGSIQVAYGTPTKYEITIYRVTVTHAGAALGWSVQSLCDEALGFGGLTLAMCPRAALSAPPAPFRF